MSVCLPCLGILKLILAVNLILMIFDNFVNANIYHFSIKNKAIKHRNIWFFPEILNSEMLKLTQWCRANKLSINFKKSNFMVFRLRQRR